ncbi:toxin-antitoxin system YwqK family antitoxin [Aureibacter tunicatorum]|uniref:Antitoxin component YwqK of YwqJK toxin-antitoxin module n=1 Tax=Aureibacter tunicatorum TaxID=866807 RepID=A0AAE4BPC0_9BACT|nr:hypothetical protein [Aureibacter tunicatorum]MDR6237804.1 antitoxin component YwqK of YwqJK toxin-antitoxin module [Aureibacter tunicatorum]BDD02839.1 hypothetical protein AUTU_03220 [Aureibacter tunicatorum]
MKNILAILIVMVMASISTFASDGIKEVDGKYYTKDGKEFTGKLESYYENGQLSQVQHFSLGLVEGPIIRYYENGNIKEIGHYTDNSKSGQWTRWDDANRIVAIAKYTQGLKDGKWIVWDSNKGVRYEISYNAGNRENVKVVESDGSMLASK